MFGDEESKQIIPAINKLKELGELKGQEASLRDQEDNVEAQENELIAEVVAEEEKEGDKENEDGQ